MPRAEQLLSIVHSSIAGSAQNRPPLRDPALVLEQSDSWLELLALMLAGEEQQVLELGDENHRLASSTDYQAVTVLIASVFLFPFTICSIRSSPTLSKTRRPHRTELTESLAYYKPRVISVRTTGLA